MGVPTFWSYSQYLGLGKIVNNLLHVLQVLSSLLSIFHFNPYCAHTNGHKLFTLIINGVHFPIS